jgi:hypothetical protein
MNDVKYNALLHDFRAQLCFPEMEEALGEVDWWDMSLGWFLAKGCSLDEASALAGIARYTHGYWTEDRLV